MLCQLLFSSKSIQNILTRLAIVAPFFLICIRRYSPCCKPIKLGRYSVLRPRILPVLLALYGKMTYQWNNNPRYLWDNRVRYGCNFFTLHDVSAFVFNPLSPNGDQHQFSPNNIHMLPREMVMRVNTMISKEKML